MLLLFAVISSLAFVNAYDEVCPRDRNFPLLTMSKRMLADIVNCHVKSGNEDAQKQLFQCTRFLKTPNMVNGFQICGKRHMSLDPVKAFKMFAKNPRLIYVVMNCESKEMHHFSVAEKRDMFYVEACIRDNALKDGCKLVNGGYA